MKRYSLIALAVVVAIVMTGCGKPPQTQIQQATSALEAAESAGAQKYAPDSWSRAQQAMDRLKAEVDAQNKRFALFRNFGTARALAADAIRAANQAAADAESQKKLASDAASLVSEVRKMFQSARSRLAALPRIRGLDAAGLKATVNAAGQQIDRARADLAAARFDSAMSTATQARDELTKVLRALEQATGMSPSKKR
jgi:hypothetical protein